MRNGKRNTCAMWSVQFVCSQGGIMKRTFIRLISDVETASLFESESRNIFSCLWARLTAKKNMMDIETFCEFKDKIKFIHGPGSMRQN